MTIRQSSGKRLVTDCLTFAGALRTITIFNFNLLEASLNLLRLDMSSRYAGPLNAICNFETPYGYHCQQRMPPEFICCLSSRCLSMCVHWATAKKSLTIKQRGRIYIAFQNML